MISNGSIGKRKMMMKKMEKRRFETEIEFQRSSSADISS
ncbi:unnamed protein product, partial [Brassica napus]